MKKFTDISDDAFVGCAVILDVDGTLVSDKNPDIDESVIKKIKSLALHSQVFICSNGSPKNAQKFAELSGVKSFDCFKPFKGGVLKLLPELPKVVVGDKYLTDGLFALNIGASFIKVPHLVGGNESLFTKMTYILDDFVWSIKNYFSLMRPWQWVKNILVIAPVFFAGGLQDKNILINVFIATIIFSIFSSITYVFNDIFDIENDRNHPDKKYRPLASGLVSLKGSLFLVLLLLFFGILGLYYLPSITLIVSTYVVLNILYTLFLKNIAVLDSVSVAFCYVLRVLAGGFATGVYISPWIVLCVFFGALFVVFGKRKGEFNREVRRRVLNEYSEKGLDIFFASSGVATVVVYSIWSVLGHESDYLIYSTIFVAVAIFRMMDIVYKGNRLSESPEVLVFKDKTILSFFVMWLIYVSLVFYLSII